MLAVSALLTSEDTAVPPLVFIHGAANSSGVWIHWQQEVAAAGWPAYAPDLRGHGKSGPVDLSRTSMQDYASDVAVLVSQLRYRPVLVGWSMGGLVAMMMAATGVASACVALAPSLPAQEVDPSVALRTGEFGPEEYGITTVDPEAQSAMADLDHEERVAALASLGRESRLARDERRRGVVIDTLRCPLLLVTGTLDRDWPAERYQDLWLPATRLTMTGASHWGLVLNRRALAEAVPAVLRWILAVTSVARSP